MISINKNHSQSGAVSLFSVIFAMLLMSVVTVSFVRIMTNDQSRATGNDLAQSAYDSAQAGVEDAKRALVWYMEQCKLSTGHCSTAAAAIGSSTCNAGIKAGIPQYASIAGEIKVQQSAQVDEFGNNVDSALDQAYTCVTMSLATPSYERTIPKDSSILVPLSANRTFASVTVEWFTNSDLPAGSAVKLSSGSSRPKGLFTASNWGNTQPSLLRTQFMQVGTSFKLTDFDAGTSDGKSNANTLFLYPTSDGASSVVLKDRDIRARTSADTPPSGINSAPMPAKCNPLSATVEYSCKITLNLPVPVGASTRDGAQAFLRLTPFYNATKVRVTLGNGAQFYGVQAIVDSTGRAGNIFRRVEARVDIQNTTFPYPEAALELTSALCKDFGVTDDRYIAGSCTP